MSFGPMSPELEEAGSLVAVWPGAVGADELEEAGSLGAV
jgi:hypothetical protein